MGDRLMPAFKTPSGIPRTSVNLKTGDSRTPQWTQGHALLSEVGTLQLEFQRLSDLTGDPQYGNAVSAVYKKLYESPGKILGGLYPVNVNVDTGHLSGAHITLGALGDSFYEYLMKMWLYTGDSFYKRMYEQTADSIASNLYRKSSPSGMGYLAEMNGAVVDKMDHLACFAGAMFALGAHGSTAQRDLDIGEAITETCWQMYARSPTGLAPELVRFSPGADMVFDPAARHNLLRPEALEAIYIMWRITGKQKYRDYAWAIFQAFNQYSRVDHGYSGIKDVTVKPPEYDDIQQSFWLAETLKYLFLIFSPNDVLPTDEWVSNTECHWLKIKRPPVEEAPAIFAKGKK